LKPSCDSSDFSGNNGLELVWKFVLLSKLMGRVKWPTTMSNSGKNLLECCHSPSGGFYSFLSRVFRSPRACMRSLDTKGASQKIGSDVPRMLVHSCGKQNSRHIMARLSLMESSLSPV